MTPKLVQLFQSTGALRVAPPGEEFKLASGQYSNIYVDCRKLLLDPLGGRFAKIIWDSVLPRASADTKLNILGGTGLGGTLLVSTCLACFEGFGWRGCILREKAKDHGTQQELEGHLPRGGYVFLLDDVLTTGGTLRKAVAFFRQQRCVLDSIHVLVDRTEGNAREDLARELGVPIFAGIHVSELLGSELCR